MSHTTRTATIHYVPEAVCSALQRPSGDGHKHLKLRPNVKRLSASAKSVYDRRRNVLREVEYSKQTSEEISHLLEKVRVHSQPHFVSILL